MMLLCAFLSMALPLGACLRGIVYAVVATGTSQSGEDTKTVTLQDERGAVVRRVALGKYAEDKSLVAGNDIAMYFARGQQSKGAVAEKGYAPTLWVFNDAYVRVLGENQSLKPLGNEIVLK